ncbi:class I SAM-dependent methyltransferase [aff. Roholtiella sp. LEGE 12411]|uniref:class I SAM-dependent methyltransferase n=1 Tax=aff. Roholtiella sp. LEGE 12411 TaxID=1828822 RepID=UPI00187EAF65|nr:class I SAM-dependent methyltransferase [aff. Roholtiella sp. LEGE 12411]MBE9039083.1 class I SAM-dependent methyltransferase [aff. Roholtiella sp. LEGE 12411]
MKIDFGATASDYAKHRAGFPSSLFDKLSEYCIGLPGQNIVDLGTGTGTLARGFAARGCDVIGIDQSGALLEQARQLDQSVQLQVKYQLATAENTALPDASADVVTAGQCWHWFDRSLAVQEVARILRANGYIAIAHFDWIPLKANVVEATEQLIEAHNPAWQMGGGIGLHPQWLRDLAEGGFREIQTFSYDVFVPYTHEDWRGRIRASAGVGASLTADKVEVFDRELAALLQAKFSTPILQVHHRVWVAIAKSPKS